MRLKPILNFAFATIGVLALFALLFFRSNLNEYVSEKIKQQNKTTLIKSIDQKIDSAYNYKKNQEPYSITFLEFGATGCPACRKMEYVMKEIKENSPEVKVRFLNVLLPENQEIMKYFGIASIPAQVLLDTSGKEFFRHTGYFSTEDLYKEIKKQKR